MASKKYMEPAWLRVYFTVGAFLIGLVLFYSNTQAHAADKVMHTSEKENAEFVSMVSDIEYNKIEIRRVDEAWKDEMKEIKDDMNRGFDEIKQLIKEID